MSNRKRTVFRNVSDNGTVTRISEEGGKFYIGDTINRAEGKMCHFSQINRKRYTNKEVPGDEWSDYAYTSDDI